MKIKCIKPDNIGEVHNLTMGEVYDVICEAEDTYYIKDKYNLHYWYKHRFVIVKEEETKADGFDTP